MNWRDVAVIAILCSPLVITSAGIALTAMRNGRSLLFWLIPVFFALVPFMVGRWTRWKR